MKIYYQRWAHRIVFALLLPLLSAIFSFSQVVDKSNDVQNVWEKAIEAKGGREKLHSIRSIFYSGSGVYSSGLKSYKRRDKSLTVFPDKFWSWDDLRPSVLGLNMTMYNLEIGKRYWAVEGDKDVALQDIEASDPVKRRFFGLIWLTLETKWYRPKAISMESGTGKWGGVDIVRTELEGERIDFYFDRKTHLARRVVFYKDLISQAPRFEINLSDYYIEWGIAVPREANNETNSYEFNVDYDESIFVKAPLPVEKAAEAWRRK